MRPNAKTRRKPDADPASEYGPEDYVPGAAQRLLDLGQTHEGLHVADAFEGMDPYTTDPLELLIQEEDENG